MDFKKATDGLFDRVDHTALAESLGASSASIRQARLSPEAKAHREPPKDWQYAVIRLAERRILKYRQLIEQVRKEVQSP